MGSHKRYFDFTARLFNLTNIARLYFLGFDTSLHCKYCHPHSRFDMGAIPKELVGCLLTDFDLRNLCDNDPFAYSTTGASIPADIQTFPGFNYTALDSSK